MLSPPLLTQMNMEYTARQWQWFLQQSQFQKQPPQSTHPRQQNTGAPAGKDNWWAEETEQAWAAASKAALYANPHIAGHRQIHQQTNYRNVPWLRKQTAEKQPTPPRSPSPLAITEQAQGSTAAPEPPNPLSHLPLAMQRLAMATTMTQAPCHPQPQAHPGPSPVLPSTAPTFPPPLAQ